MLPGSLQDRLYARFPQVCQFLRDHGIDPAREITPISPAAHYMIGGVATDRMGRTSVPSLLACGEVASTGVHGANRSASNSLLEGLVFGERVARLLRGPAHGGPLTPRERLRIAPVPWEGRGFDPRTTTVGSRGCFGRRWGSFGRARSSRPPSGTLDRFRRLTEPSSEDDLPGADRQPRPPGVPDYPGRPHPYRESRGSLSDRPSVPRGSWRRHLGLVRGGRSVVDPR